MEKYRGSWSSFFTMPRAATASVGYWETKSGLGSGRHHRQRILQGGGEADG